MTVLQDDEDRDPQEAVMLDLADTAAEFPEEAEEFKKKKAANEIEVVSKPQSVTIRDTDATSFLDPNVYIQLKALAQDFINSGAIPSVWSSASQVLVGLQAGAEMGMKPMEAMNSLYPVNGAINVWGKATTRRLKVHGFHIKYFDESQESCTATVWRGKNPVKPASTDEQYTETFTFEGARLSGYTMDNSGRLKIGWKPGMNRKKKLRYGVLALIIATYVPEVLGSAIGIVEVSEDYNLREEPSPKQINAADRQARIEAGVNKRKELTNGNFKPAAVKSQSQPTESED